MNSKRLTAAENRECLFKLQGAVLRRDRLEVKHILDSGARLPRTRQFQPLVNAAKLNRSSILSLLLKAGASPNAFGVCGQGWTGETALHAAVLYGPLKSIVALIDAGANVNARDSSGRCPLWYLPFRTFSSAKTRQSEAENILRIFTKVGENVINAQRCQGVTVRPDRIVGKQPEIGIGSTLLHLTACFGNKDLVSLVISAGADLDQISVNPRILFN